MAGCPILAQLGWVFLVHASLHFITNPSTVSFPNTQPGQSNLNLPIPSTIDCT